MVPQSALDFVSVGMENKETVDYNAKLAARPIPLFAP